MRLALVVIALVAVGVIAISAALFDTTTVLMVVAAMVIVGVCSGASVAFAVLTRRGENSRHALAHDDHSVVIPDQPRDPAAPR